MNKKNNALFIIWGVLVAIIIAFLAILGFGLKSVKKEYLKIEEELKENAEKYAKNNSLYTDTEGLSITITKQDLIKEGYITDLKHKKDVCDGYVILKYIDNEYEFKSYIKCPKYTSSNYKDAKK